MRSETSVPRRVRASVPAVMAAVLALTGAAGAQLLPHAPKAEPGAQIAAAREQQAVPEAANQFGTRCCQILQVPAAAFTPVDTSLAGYLSFGNPGGYQVLNGGSIAAEVWAPVTLPSGAALDFLTIYYYDADATNDICVELDALAGTTSPTTTTIATSCSALGVGYGYSKSVASGTINNDVVGGGAQYVVMVYDSAPSSNLQFKAVDIWWHRQISPAPAVATFNDVPTSDPFFRSVEALAASGITAGCQVSPPLFCPDAPLTRKQMAAFLSVALGLYWPY